MLFDTNILLDYLNGVKQARTEVEGYSDKAISPITWMEIMVGEVPEKEEATRRFLSTFINLPIDDQVASLLSVCERAIRSNCPMQLYGQRLRQINAPSLLVTPGIFTK